MGKKFLIIDDSALMRRVISDIIKEKYDDVEEFVVLKMTLNSYYKTIMTYRIWHVKCRI